MHIDLEIAVTNNSQGYVGISMWISCGNYVHEIRSYYVISQCHVTSEERFIASISGFVAEVLRCAAIYTKP